MARKLKTGQSGAAQNLDGELPKPLAINRKELIRADETPKFPPGLAAKMVDLAVAGLGDVAVFDPFVGGGTILLEASTRFSNVRSAMGSDISGDAVAATQLNMEHVGRGAPEFPKVTVVEGNALTRKLPKSDHPLVVVTDPPFGRACGWVDQAGASSQESQLEAFLENMASQKPRRVVFCFDIKEDVKRQVRRHFPKVRKIDERDKNRSTYVAEF